MIKELEKALEYELVKARVLAIDPYDLSSRPSEKQDAVLRDVSSLHIYVIAGNQCLAKDTEVLTSEGIKFIQDVQVGDTVYDENGEPIEVKKTFKNGVKPVRTLKHRGTVAVQATDNHVFLTSNSSSKNGRKEKELSVQGFGRDTQIKRVHPKAPLGNVIEPHAYSIGVFLGDGCSTVPGKVISGQDPEIIYAVANEIGASSVTKYKHTYNWRLTGSPDCNHYDLWCKNKKAHEKTVDIDIIKTWNRTSLLSYVAGVIDTDGSIFIDKWDNLVISCEMQALPVIESLVYAFKALWQINLNITINDREKYVNGATHTVKVANNVDSKRALKELTYYLKCPRKQWKGEYECLEAKRTSDGWCGVTVSEDIVAVETYDIHVDSPRNLYCLANGLVTHNSGKSQLGGRILSWKFNENHPYWKRSPEWGDEPLLLIVAGRISDQVEELWRNKIEPYLEPGSYKVVKQGPTLKHVEHKKNGNKILFTSHDKAEQAKEKIQSYVAHHFWLDEMPGHESYIEEAHRRVDAKQGQFLATFTPKVRNDKVRDMVDNSDPSIASIYRMGKLDNPIYHGREDIEKAKISHLPQRIQQNILFGDWLDADESVFSYVRDENSAALPPHYSRLWPHLVAYDPASSSNSGLAMFAFDQTYNQWWVVDAQYKKFSSPSEHIAWLEEYLGSFNIVRRVCDNEPWFYNEYHKQTGTSWMPIPEKTQRKKDLIAKLQESLHHKTLKFKKGMYDLEKEFRSAEWKPGYEGEKIKNSQRFHLIDAVQYGLDMLPKLENEQILNHDARMIEAFIAEQQVAQALRVTKSVRGRKKIKNSFNRTRKRKGWIF